MGSRGIKLVGATAAIALLALGGLLLHPLLWPPDFDASLRMEEGRLLGQAVGHVVAVDGRMVELSASLFDLQPTGFQVGADTTITIGDKQGGLGDIRKDMPIRVDYEKRDDVRLAKSISLVIRDAAIVPPTATASEAPASATPTEPAASPPPAPASPTLPTPAAASAADGGPQVPKRVEAPPPGTAPLLVVPRPAAPAPPVAARPAAKPPAAPPPARRRRTDEPPAQAARDRAVSRGSDAEDGTAAIDWLLNEGRGR
jgi:hypothetical protein